MITRTLNVCVWLKRVLDVVVIPTEPNENYPIIAPLITIKKTIIFRLSSLKAVGTQGVQFLVNAVVAEITSPGAAPGGHSGASILQKRTTATGYAHQKH